MTKRASVSLFRKIIYGFLVFIGLILIGAAIYLNSLLPIITGYAAKNLASATFVSGREPATVESIDLNFSFISMTKNSVDYDDKSVTSRFLWGRSKAIYREGFGVTLLRNCKEEELRMIKFPVLPDPGYSRDTIAWPLGDLVTATDTCMDLESLSSISDKLVWEDAYGGKAFAFMVLHNGIPVAEAYREGFSADTRLLSWSMGKSVTNALVGILAGEGKLDIYKQGLLAQWDGDERSKINLDNLMQMESGLEWNEDYGNRSDVTVMLHCENDFAAFAFNKPAEYPAASHWYYSSGTTNIVSYIIREQLGNDDEYYIFPHRDLFYRIGITDAVFEVDPSGTMVGSSYLYMTARDYARFALLYLQDGVFNNERVLPEGWVDYTVTPASASNGGYGSFFWLNGNGEVPSAPEDTYMCIGHDGQRIFILPSHDLVIVVLGYSPSGSMDFDRLMSDILGTMDKGL